LHVVHLEAQPEAWSDGTAAPARAVQLQYGSADLAAQVQRDAGMLLLGERDAERLVEGAAGRPFGAVDRQIGDPYGGRSALSGRHTEC
jgi:hypothetical protein